MTNHVLAGATIGVLLGRRPVAAFGAGVVSHFVMDACPHWGIRVDTPEGAAEFLRVAKRDGYIGLLAMAAGTVIAERRVRPATVAAMIGAALPDLNKPSMIYLGIDPFPRWFGDLHNAVQNEAPGRLPVELATAACLAGLALGAHWGLRVAAR